jgi:hypothetical protein
MLEVQECGTSWPTVMKPWKNAGDLLVSLPSSSHEASSVVEPSCNK